MAAAKNETMECPSCKEEIRVGAVLCKHCRSRVGARSPEHEGVCPYCKEEVHPEATRCKHCGSSIGAREEGGCGCSPGGGQKFDDRGRHGKRAGGCGCSPGPAARFGDPRSLAMRAGGYPDPECFHECFWRCYDAIGDAQQCWIACAYLCPEAVLAY